MAQYKALTFVVLQEDGERLPPGTIFSDSDASKESIQELLDSGAISKDKDAELHPDHLPPEAPTAEEGKTHVQAGDSGRAGE
jgi:hypothetical protein